MSKTKGTSNVPLIMGIIGFVLGIPNAICAGFGGALVGSAAGGLSTADADMTLDSEAVDAAVAAAEAGAMAGVQAALWLGGIAMLLGLIAGILGKSKPSISGIGMLLAAGLLLFQMTGTFNLLAFIIAVLYIIGGIIAFTQKKEVVQ